MAETIVDGRWHWYNVMEDLRTQGGVETIIDPTSVVPRGCAGTAATGTLFNITWVPNRLLMLSMSAEDLSLVEAFATVVEYRPFCRYVSRESGLLTYEWDKEDPQGRLRELQDEGEPELQEVS